MKRFEQNYTVFLEHGDVYKRQIHTLLKNWDEECPLTREEAVEVLNLPEEEMDSLMECCLLYTSTKEN